MKQQAQPMQVMFSILERGKGTDFIAHYQAFQVPLHIHTTGRGTAASHLLDTLGFATEERDILISVGTKNAVRQLMRHLHDEDRSKLGARGIACSFSVNGMNSALAIGLSGSQEEEAAEMVQTHQHSLILIAVNQGYTDAVMETARTAGAKGGTVIRARWTGAEAVQHFLNITLQSEKEILAIVAANSDRKAIMEAINRDHGLTSKAQAAIFSVPVDAVARID